jgi:hypothetical protein
LERIGHMDERETLQASLKLPLGIIIRTWNSLEGLPSKYYLGQKLLNICSRYWTGVSIQHGNSVAKYILLKNYMGK